MASYYSKLTRIRFFFCRTVLVPAGIPEYDIGSGGADALPLPPNAHSSIVIHLEQHLDRRLDRAAKNTLGVLMAPRRYVHSACQRAGATSRHLSIGTTPWHARSAGMEPSTDTQIKLRIGYALSDRLTPIACAIVKNITTSTKMIDDLPSAAIEAVLDYSKEQHRLDRPRTAAERAYNDVRQALIAYGEVALREARAREDRSFYGLTERRERRSLR
jgi:hypothetical protein